MSTLISHVFDFQIYNEHLAVLDIDKDKYNSSSVEEGPESQKHWADNPKGQDSSRNCYVIDNQKDAMILAVADCLRQAKCSEDSVTNAYSAVEDNYDMYEQVRVLDSLAI